MIWDVTCGIVSSTAANIRSWSDYFLGVVMVPPEAGIERTWPATNLLFIENRVPSSVSYAPRSRRDWNTRYVRKNFFVEVTENDHLPHGIFPSNFPSPLFMKNK